MYKLNYFSIYIYIYKSTPYIHNYFCISVNKFKVYAILLVCIHKIM